MHLKAIKPAFTKTSNHLLVMIVYHCPSSALATFALAIQWCSSILPGFPITRLARLAISHQFTIRFHYDPWPLAALMGYH